VEKYHQQAQNQAQELVPVPLPLSSHQDAY